MHAKTVSTVAEVNVDVSSHDGTIDSTVFPSPKTLETKGDAPLERNGFKRETKVGYGLG